MGEYWSDSVYVNIELNQFDSKGDDNLNWTALMDAFGQDGDRRDIFSQSGYVSAKFFVDALLELDPDSIDRASVTAAIKGIVGVESDLLCDPYYVGEADRHMPNHTGRMVVFRDGGFELVRDCYDIDTDYLEPILAQEAVLGLR